jgi:ATP/maltotriose-dependent transcriptional regulator MalT
LKTVKEAFRLSDNQDDIHGRINAAVLVARIDLAQGSAQRALDVTALELDRQPGPSMLGDFVAIRALAFALSGDNAAALRLADESETLTDHVDTRVRASFVRAIVDLRTRTEPGPSEATSAAFRAVGEAEAFDGFVLAYRSYPPLLKALVGQGDESARACRAHISSVDRRLAERAGLAGRSKLEISGDKLTQREREVLALVRRGLSNREIASTLWIAESTAKVHVRNVLRKLGARSRAEAASLTNP